MSVGIMLLPAEGEVPTIEDAHCTLVWAGELAELPAGTASMMGARCRFLADTTPPFEALVIGTDVFGEGEETTEVIRIAHTFLVTMRRWVVEWNRSQYVEYKPHVSYKGAVQIPPTISFDRIALWLGDARKGPAQRATWRLGTGDRIY